MLFRTELIEVNDVAFFDLRQQAVALIILGVILSFLVHGDEAGLDENGSVSSEYVTGVFRARGEIDRNRIEYGGDHLAGHRSFPDQRVKPELVVLERPLEVVGMARD